MNGEKRAPVEFRRRGAATEVRHDAATLRMATGAARDGRERRRRREVVHVVAVFRSWGGEKD